MTMVFGVRIVPYNHLKKWSRMSEMSFDYRGECFDDVDRKQKDHHS